MKIYLGMLTSGGCCGNDRIASEGNSEGG